MGDAPVSVEDLVVFRHAHQLVLEIYQITEGFPRAEKFGLVSQLRRAAASVPANLAEGGARLNRKEYRQCVGISRGSVAEVAYHLLLAKDLGYISDGDHRRIRNGYTRVGRMLTRLVKALS